MELVNIVEAPHKTDLYSAPVGAVFRFQGELCMKVYSLGSSVRFVSLLDGHKTWDFSTTHASETSVNLLPPGTQITLQV